jgi:hypothetical protein
MVAAQADEGYEALEKMPDFWQIVRQLYEEHSWATQARRTAHERRDEGARARRADVIDVEAAESEENSEGAGSRDAPNNATLERDDGVSSPDLDGAEDSVEGKSRASTRKTRRGDSE